MNIPKVQSINNIPHQDTVTQQNNTILHQNNAIPHQNNTVPPQTLNNTVPPQAVISKTTNLLSTLIVLN
jgi:hypothetical protein